MGGVYGEPFAPVLHELRVYDNAIMAVLAVNLDMADDKTRAAYREMKRETLAGGNPIIRAEWDVYLRDGALVYIKEDWRGRTMRGAYSTWTYRPRSDGKRRTRRGGASAAACRSCSRQYGVRLDGGCMMRRPLPDYPVAGIETGAADSVRGGWIGLARFGSAAAGRGLGAGLRARIPPRVRRRRSANSRGFRRLFGRRRAGLAEIPMRRG